MKTNEINPNQRTIHDQLAEIDHGLAVGDPVVVKNSSLSCYLAFGTVQKIKGHEIEVHIDPWDEQDFMPGAEITFHSTDIKKRLL